MGQLFGEHLLEDAPVHDEHHNAWNPKANRAGDERIGLVDHKRALIRTQWDLTQMLRRCVPAQKDGRKWNEGGQYPDIGEHKTDGAVCHIQWILQGTHYCIVSVKRGVGRNGKLMTDSIYVATMDYLLIMRYCVYIFSACLQIYFLII